MFKVISHELNNKLDLEISFQLQKERIIKIFVNYNRSPMQNSSVIKKLTLKASKIK